MRGDTGRAARRDRRAGTDALAHGRRLRACRLLSRARRRAPARHGRRRRARALPHRGACERPADRRRRWCGTAMPRAPSRWSPLDLSERHGPTPFARRPISRQRSDDADIVSCATLSPEPLVKGAWLKPGAHLDLVGAFTPQMRESDDEAVTPRDGLCRHARRRAEGGGRHRPAARGGHHQRSSTSPATSSTSAAATRPGRHVADEITLFKSVGTALEDLAAAHARLRRPWADA